MAAVAFIGLGTMARGMVHNLLQAGHDVTVHSRSSTRIAEVVELGAVAAPSAAEAVLGAEYVMYCLADDAAVEDVVLAEGGLVENVPKDALVIDLSTISPQTGLREHAAYGERGVRFLDAPVFGSRGETDTGGLWIVVGGKDEDVEAALPVLEPISASLHHMGGPGSGHRMKLVGNLLVASQLQALGDALTLADKAGLDLRSVLGVLDVTDFRTPIYSGVGRRVIADDYAKDFALKLLVKDLHLIGDFARDLGVELPGTVVTTRLAEKALEEGLGEENASAVIKVIAQRSGARLSS